MAKYDYAKQRRSRNEQIRKANANYKRPKKGDVGPAPKPFEGQKGGQEKKKKAPEIHKPATPKWQYGRKKSY